VSISLSIAKYRESTHDKVQKATFLHERLSGRLSIPHTGVIPWMMMEQIRPADGLEDRTSTTTVPGHELLYKYHVSTLKPVPCMTKNTHVHAHPIQTIPYGQRSNVFVLNLQSADTSGTTQQTLPSQFHCKTRIKLVHLLNALTPSTSTALSVPAVLLQEQERNELDFFKSLAQMESPPTANTTTITTPATTLSSLSFRLARANVLDTRRIGNMMN